jgi:hypothetical protein
VTDTSALKEDKLPFGLREVRASNYLAIIEWVLPEKRVINRKRQGNKKWHEDK